MQTVQNRTGGWAECPFHTQQTRFWVFWIVSIFHSKREGFPDWKIPSLDSFSESLIKEQAKLSWMGVINTYEDQYFLVTDSSKVEEKGKSKKEDTKAADSNQQTFERAFSSKRKKKKCPYCMRGFHPEDSCMKKTLDQMKALCLQNNISFQKREVIWDNEEHTEEYEICLHASLSPSKAYVIDFGAYNQMVASMESFISFPLSWGPSIHMENDSKIPYVERGSDKI